jgi:hypothetical protein
MKYVPNKYGYELFAIIRHYLPNCKYQWSREFGFYTITNADNGISYKINLAPSERAVNEAARLITWLSNSTIPMNLLIREIAHEYEKHRKNARQESEGTTSEDAKELQREDADG